VQKPHEKSGRLTRRNGLPDSVYAFPRQRKEPLTDAKHVRNAIARLDQVEDASSADRDLAFANIRKAAAHYGVERGETSAREVGVHPQSPAKKAKRSAARTPREKA
jgi:ABC-type Na+ efflux pump permease subunit